MNERMVKIVQKLSRSVAPCSLKDLAHEFGVSERTIRNDIKQINNYVGKESLGSIAYGAQGRIILPQDFARVEKILPLESTFAYKMSSDERKELAAATLIGAASSMTLGEIADLFSVSRATILNDFDGVKELVAQAGLAVESKSGHGVWASGPESKRRAFLISFLGQSTPIVDQWLAFPGNSCVKSYAIIVKKVLNEQCHASGIHMPDGPFQHVVNHLCVCVLRNKEGFSLEDLGTTFKGCSADEVIEFEKNVVRLVGQYCSVDMGPNEELFFSATVRPYRRVGGNEFDVEDFRIKKLARVFIKNVSQEMGVGLNGDYDFFEYLSNHLETMFATEPSHFPESAALEEAVHDQPVVLKVVEGNLPLIEEYAGRKITETETKYLALHVCAALERKKNMMGRAPRVAVVCDGGVGTSQLLAEELKGHFDIRVVGVMPAHDVSYIDARNTDLVISTVPLDSCPVECVSIHFPLREEEYGLLHNKLDLVDAKAPEQASDELSAKGLIERLEPIVVAHEGADSPLIQEIRAEVRRYFQEVQGLEGEILAPYLHQLLPASHIKLDVACTDWRDAIRKSAEPLLSMGYVEQRYVEAMIASVERFGPYDVLAPGFAVPHASPENGAIKMGMSLIRLKEPVPFGGSGEEPVEFVCTLSAVDRKTHLKAFANLLDIITMPNNQFLTALHEAGTEAEAASLIEHFEFELVR